MTLQLWGETSRITLCLFLPHSTDVQTGKGQEDLRALATGRNPRVRSCLLFHLGCMVGFVGVPGGCDVPRSYIPAGAQMQLSSGLRHLAELQMLVLGDVELEFVLLKELAELLDIALVKLVHLLP